MSGQEDQDRRGDRPVPPPPAGGNEDIPSPPPYRHGPQERHPYGCWGLVLLAAVLAILGLYWWTGDPGDPRALLPKETVVYIESTPRGLMRKHLETLSFWKDADRGREAVHLLEGRFVERLSARLGGIRRLDLVDLVESVKRCAVACAPGRGGDLEWIVWAEVPSGRRAREFLAGDMGLSMTPQSLEGEEMYRVASKPPLYLLARPRSLLLSPDRDLLEFAIEARQGRRETLADIFELPKHCPDALVRGGVNIGLLRSRVPDLDHASRLLLGDDADPLFAAFSLSPKECGKQSGLVLDTTLVCRTAPAGVVAPGKSEVLQGRVPRNATWALALDGNATAPRWSEAIRDRDSRLVSLLRESADKALGLPPARLFDIAGDGMALFAAPGPEGESVTAAFPMPNPQEAALLLEDWVTLGGGATDVRSLEGHPALLASGPEKAPLFALIRDDEDGYLSRHAATVLDAARNANDAPLFRAADRDTPAPLAVARWVDALELLGLKSHVRADSRWALAVTGREGTSVQMRMHDFVSEKDEGGESWGFFGWLIRILLAPVVLVLALIALFLLATILLACYFYVEAWWRGELTPPGPPPAPELSPELREDLGAPPDTAPEPAPTAPAEPAVDVDSVEDEIIVEDQSSPAAAEEANEEADDSTDEDRPPPSGGNA